jgi:hypothetical protein
VQWEKNRAQTKNLYLILNSLKREVGMFRGFLAIFLIAGAFGGQAGAGEFVDYGTQHQIMPPFADFMGDKGTEVLALHICASGSFMTGVHVKYNRFLCEDGLSSFRGGAYSPSDIRTNLNPNKQPPVRYQSHGMAACPPGTAMVGLHAARNVLLCVPLQTTDWFIDANTARYGMHACPQGSVMAGIHVGRNLLLCGRPH